jgi:hypothetical protein
MSEELLVRLFAECADEVAAQSVAADLLRALGGFRAQSRQEPQRYWKMPELFEFTFALRPPTPQALADLLAHGAGEWDRRGDEHDRSCVWNRSDGCTFLLPEVRWAEAILTRHEE